MSSDANLTVDSACQDEGHETQDSPAQYVLLETPMKNFMRLGTFAHDDEAGLTGPICSNELADSPDPPANTMAQNLPRELQAITVEDLQQETGSQSGQKRKGNSTEHTMQTSSVAPRDSEVMPILPTRYFDSQFQSNSYFSKKLFRLSQLIVLGDLVGLGMFYFSNSDNHRSFLFFLVHSHDSSCATSLALAALVYHLCPAVFILGLPASGLRVFEPFRREHRIDRGGRLQKVKRTVCLQVCELVGVGIFLYITLILSIGIYYVASGKIFVGCEANLPAYVFCGFALVMFWLLFVLMRAFAGFREHIKMQLGAFKECDQTGDIKAHMVRSKMKWRKRHQEKYGTSIESTLASIQIQDIKKQLFRGAQLGDLKLLRRSIQSAQTHLGEKFALDLYPDPVMIFGIFGLATKNPMHVAAYQGNIAALELLYKAKFRVNAFDKVSRQRFSTGDLFWYFASFFIPKLVVPADDTNSSVFKTTLVTPLHCAVSTGRLAAVRWLIAHGANVNLCSKSSYRSESRLPPIFLADHPEIVHELLRARANHLAIPDPGHINTVTVLQLAYLRGNYAVAQVLEDWGGDVALTPLHAAAAMDDVATIRSLLRKNVHPDVLGELGYVGLNKRTPLHWAAVNGAVCALEILLAAKANANFQDAQGRTALHWAARVNRLNSVKVLLAYGADPTIVDDGDMTPIMCAACAGGTSVDMFKVLVASGGDMNHQLGLTGDTALHLAVKLDDQQTALALLSMGGDLMQTNHDGFRPIDCTTSTRLQFEIKRAAGTRDVMISYTHSHLEFALKLRKSLEDAHITVWLDLMDPSGIGGGSVWREEIARGITNAAVVLCILTEDYTRSEWCLKELALAKQVGTPILAISTEHAQISEELQVYLYTRQLVPFERAILKVEDVNGNEVRYTYDEIAYRDQLRMLLDGMRDVIEKRKEKNIRRNMRRTETNPLTHSSYTPSGLRSRRLKHTVSSSSCTSTYGMDSMKIDERTLTSSAINPLHYSVLSPTTSSMHKEYETSTKPYMLHATRHRNLHGSSQSIGSMKVLPPGVRHRYDFNGTNLSALSSSSSSNSYVDDCGESDGVVLDAGGYYFHRTMKKEDVIQHGSRTPTLSDKNLKGGKAPSTSDSIVENLHDLNTATASGEQCVFISHGDYHQRFVQKLCVELCRNGGLRCYVDRKHMVQLSSTIDEEKEEEVDKIKSKRRMNEDMSMRIHDAKEAILKCSAFMLLVSEKTLASELVKDQLAFAEDKGKKILPVVVNRTDFSLDVKYSLARSEFVHFFTKGDMMAFQQSLRHLLLALHAEVYGMRSGDLPPHLRPPCSMYSIEDVAYGNGSNGHLRGGFANLRDTSLSAESSWNPSFQMSQSLISTSRSDKSPFVLPSPRLSQTFSVGSGTTRSISSDTGLSQSLIGNFSALISQYSDEEEKEEEDVCSYAGVFDDNIEEIELGNDDLMHVVHGTKTHLTS